jgi:hypothetical protein
LVVVVVVLLLLVVLLLVMVGWKHGAMIISTSNACISIDACISIQHPIDIVAVADAAGWSAAPAADADAGVCYVC